MKNLAFLCILLAAQLAAASTPPEGPTDLQLGDAEGQLVLTWIAPGSWSPDGYRVFLDGKLATVTNKTALVVGQAQTYAVQAIGASSASTPSLLVTSDSGGPVGGGPLDCSYVTVSIEPDGVHPRVHEHCFTWIKEVIGNDRLPVQVFLHLLLLEEN